MRILSVNANQIENEGAIAFAEYLRKIDTLEILNMSCNTISDDGFEELFESLKPSANSEKLREINISENWIESGNVINALTELMGLLKGLKSLNISKLEIAKKKHQDKIIECLCNAPFTNQLHHLFWDSDIKVDSVGREAI